MKRIKYLILSLVVAFCLIIIVKEGYMSQTMYKHVTLEQLVSQSPCIFIAEKSDPFEIIEHIEIVPFYKRLFNKKYPPYQKISYSFVVKEILYTEYPLTVGSKIKVSQSNWESEFKQHKRYILEDISISPIYFNYESGADLYDSDELILFTDKKYNFYMDGAYELPSKKDEIIKLKTSSPKRAMPEIE